MIRHIDTETWFCGDIHGNFACLPYALGHLHDCSVVFCGDIGLGFDSPISAKVTDFLGRNRINCWLVRGNHDDPSLFTDSLVAPRMIAMRDYTVLRSGRHTILCVGGGLSIDRSWRKEREAQFLKYHSDAAWKIWWEDEMPVFNRIILESFPDDLKIDTVCTHAAPASFPPFTEIPEVFARQDASLLGDAKAERNTLEELKCWLAGHCSVKQWFYGHYHTCSDVMVDDIRAVCLDMARDGKLCMKKIGNNGKEK